MAIIKKKSSQINYSSSQSKGLIGWWGFDKPISRTIYEPVSGQKAVDGSGSNFSWVLDDIRGWVPDLNGTSDFFSAGTSSIFSPSQLSVSLWLKPTDYVIGEFSVGNVVHALDAIPPTTTGIISKSTSVNSGVGWSIIFDGESTFYFIVETDVSTSVSISDLLTWHHIVGTWNGDTISIYVDGKIGTNDSHIGALTSTSADLTIGDTPDRNPFYGRIDDVRIYNRGLTQSEVNHLYNIQTRYDLWLQPKPEIASFLVGGSTNTYNETSTGGALCNGSATIAVVYNPPATGGALCNGSAIREFIAFPPVTGGILCNGSATIAVVYNPPATGGSLCNSSATIAVVYNPPITGGALCNGSAIREFIAFPVVTGGALCNGSATIAVVYNPPITGGALCNGSAIREFIAFPVVTGGVLCNGSATIAVVYNPPATGGALCNGSATIAVVYNPPVTGGALCNGSAIREFIAFPVITGGALCNGSATIAVVYNPPATGGALCNGSAIREFIAFPPVTGGVLCNSSATVAVVYNPPVTGGALCNGSATNTIRIIYTFVGSVICGGITSPIAIYNPVIVPGCIISGTATTTAIYAVGANGTVLCGGQAKQDNSIDEFSTGGIVCSSSAIVTVLYNVQPSKGCLANSNTEVVVTYNLLTSGGILANSSASISKIDLSISISGGIVCNGLLGVNSVFNPDISGGSLVAGLAFNTQIFNSIATSGGVVCAGTAVLTSGLDSDTSGGVICNGLSIHGISRDHATSGGANCSGNSLNYVIYNISASNGAICGGLSLVGKTYATITSSGGSVCSGLSNITANYNVETTSGCLLNGISNSFVVYNIAITGGAICNGLADLGATNPTFEASGGILCNSNATILCSYNLHEASQGSVCNGNSICVANYIIIGNGGAVAGGTAGGSGFSDVTTSGGAICNGEENIVVNYNISPAIVFGCQTSGISSINVLYYIVSSDGATCSGTASLGKEFLDFIGSGGVICGGSSDINANYNITTANGLLANNSAITEGIYNLTSTIAVIVSGDGLSGVTGPTIIATNGIIVSGDPNLNTIYNINVSGGVNCSNPSTTIHDINASGGTIANGNSLNASIVYEIGSGGLVLNGSILIFTKFNFTTISSVICSGSSSTFANYNLSSYANVKTSGLSDSIVVYYPALSGGGLVNGVLYIVSIQPFISGGSIVNGSSEIRYISNISPTKGVICSGVTDTTFNDIVETLASVIVSGNAKIEQPIYHYTTGGEAIIIGFAKTKGRGFFHFLPTGTEISINGSFHSINGYIAKGTGEIIVSGSFAPRYATYRYRPKKGTIKLSSFASFSFDPVSNGGTKANGSAEVNILRHGYSSLGDIIMNGSSIINNRTYRTFAKGKITVIPSSVYFYVTKSNGGVKINGASDINIKKFSYISSGSIIINDTTIVSKASYKFNTYGKILLNLFSNYKFNANANGGAVLGGISEINIRRYNYIAAGHVEMNSMSIISATYKTFSAGSVNINGTWLSKPSHYNYISKGSVHITGKISSSYNYNDINCYSKQLVCIKKIPNRYKDCIPSKYYFGDCNIYQIKDCFAGSTALLPAITVCRQKGYLPPQDRHKKIPK